GPGAAPGPPGQPVEAEGDGEGQDDGGRGREQEQAHGVPDRLPEGPVGQDALVEAPADELTDSARARPVERADHGLTERDEEDEAEGGGGGRDEQDPPPPLAVHVGPGYQEPPDAAHRPVSPGGSGPSWPPPRRGAAWAAPSRRGRRPPLPRTRWPARSTWGGSRWVGRAGPASPWSTGSRAGSSRTGGRGSRSTPA